MSIMTPRVTDMGDRQNQTLVWFGKIWLFYVKWYERNYGDPA